MFKNINVKYVLFVLVTIGLVLITDPEFIAHISFIPAGSAVALVSIIAFSFVGFIITTIAPDAYMDKEYQERRSKADPGLVLMARAIHTLGFCLIFAVSLYVFVGA